MLRKGLEPLHLSIPDPKSGVSPNSTTEADLLRHYFFKTEPLTNAYALCLRKTSIFKDGIRIRTGDISFADLTP